MVTPIGAVRLAGETPARATETVALPFSTCMDTAKNTFAVGWAAEQNEKQRVKNIMTTAVKKSRKLSHWRLSAYVGASLGVLVLAAAALVLVFGAAILDGYGKRKVERSFAEAHPGWVLQIGQLAYSIRSNLLDAQSVTLSATNATLKIDRMSLMGVRWGLLLRGSAAPADVLAKAVLQATNLDVEFPNSHYGIRCARLRASAPDSELIAEATELRTSVGEEAFFAADEYRTTFFHVVVPECRVLGLAYGPLLEGKSYRASSIHISGPTLEALVNRDKPMGPFVKSPLMVHEALAAIRQPLQIDSLSITNGNLKYCERLAVGAEPGVLTISKINLSAEGIANRGEAPAAILLRGQGNLMDAGTLKVLLSIPIAPPDFSLHYSGSLTAMALTRLDAFLDIAENVQIKSGDAQSASFDIDVTAGQARGRVRGIYQNLEIAILDKRTGSAERIDLRAASFLANMLKIRHANGPGASESMKEGVVNYTKRPADQFQQFLWFALRTGVLDIINQ
jgi:hypothetical protein